MYLSHAEVELVSRRDAIEISYARGRLRQKTKRQAGGAVRQRIDLPGLALVHDRLRPRIRVGRDRHLPGGSEQACLGQWFTVSVGQRVIN